MQLAPSPVLGGDALGGRFSPSVAYGPGAEEHSLSRRATIGGLLMVGSVGSPRELTASPESPLSMPISLTEAVPSSTPGGGGTGEQAAFARSMSMGAGVGVGAGGVLVPPSNPVSARPSPAPSPRVSRNPSVCSLASQGSMALRSRLFSGMAPVHEERQHEADTPKASQSLAATLAAQRPQAKSPLRDTQSNLLSVDVGRRESVASNRSAASIRSFNMGFQPMTSNKSAYSASTVSSAVSEAASYSIAWFRARWRHFSLFGVTQDQTPRVWGNRVKANTRRVSTESDSGQSIDRAKFKQLNKMVKHHTYHDEMRLQLRDDRVDLTYLDAFATDHHLVDGCHVRVFSFGATLLEYLKIFVGMWAFFVSLTLVAFWEVIMVPDHVNQQFTLMFVDLVVDFVYMACLAMQLRTTILDVSSGREFCATKKIVSSNLSSLKFWADWMSCVPLILMSGIFNGSSIIRWITLVKTCRGWRIFRTPPEHRFVPSTVFQLVQLSCSILMGGHLLACVWFMLVHEGEDTMRYHVPWSNQAYRHCLESGPTASCFWNLYTVSINQGIYLLMGIECEAYSAVEHFFLTLCAPAGALVHAYMLGQVILLIQRRGALETKQNEHTMAIQEAMRILGLPPNLQMRIVTFFTYERIHRSGRLLHGLFTDLSPQLRFELQLHCYLDLVGGSGLFKKARPRVIREIVVSLNDIIFLPGDWICRYGDYGDSMYFIVNGACAVIDKDTVTQLRVLTNGAYFGEVALLTGVTRTAYVRANSFCIMAHLTKEKFRPIVEKWPEETCDVLIGAQKESDQLKIKMEATRHYALSSRRMSVASTGGMGMPNMVSMPSLQQRGSATNLDRAIASPALHRRNSKSSIKSTLSSTGSMPDPDDQADRDFDILSATEADVGFGPRRSDSSTGGTQARATAGKAPEEKQQGLGGQKQKKEMEASGKNQLQTETWCAPKTLQKVPSAPAAACRTEVKAFDSMKSEGSSAQQASGNYNTSTENSTSTPMQKQISPMQKQISSSSSNSSSSNDDIPFISSISEGGPSSAEVRRDSTQHRVGRFGDAKPKRPSMEWRLSIPAEAPPELLSSPRPSPKPFCELPGMLKTSKPVVEEDLLIEEDLTKVSKDEKDEDFAKFSKDEKSEDFTKALKDEKDKPKPTRSQTKKESLRKQLDAETSQLRKEKQDLERERADLEKEIKKLRCKRDEELQLISPIKKQVDKEKQVQSHPMTTSEVTTANTLLKEENEMLRNVRKSLKEVARHVTHLQTEVMDQQELLRSSLLDVRTWAVEATRDAVSQEVLKFQSERNSLAPSPDSSLPLATPFT